MAFVVTDNCRDCRYTDCVEVCPVDCFHGDEHMLYIDPAVCIDCGACVPECPVEAIFSEGTLPPEFGEWLALNAERARNLPVVNERGSPLPSASQRLREFGLVEK